MHAWVVIVCLGKGAHAIGMIKEIFMKDSAIQERNALHQSIDSLFTIEEKWKKQREWAEIRFVSKMNEEERSEYFGLVCKRRGKEVANKLIDAVNAELRRLVCERKI